MAFLLILVGALFAISAYRGTQAQLWQLFISDVTGTSSYVWVFIAIGVIGLLGSIREIQPVMRPFLLLIVIALVVSNGTKGFFQNFVNQVKQADASATTAPKDATSVSGIVINTQSSNLGGSGGGNPISPSSVIDAATLIGG